MNVRGFTKSRTSKVKDKGTFSGIINKIPYLKELGITTIELQPAYEFDEIGRFPQLTDTIMSKYGAGNNCSIFERIVNIFIISICISNTYLYTKLFVKILLRFS